MRVRIWDELAQSKFHLDYLCLYVKKLIKQNKMVDNVVLFTSLIGIFSWYKLADLAIFWSLLLAGIAIFRMMKSKFFPTEQEISTLNSVCEFYIDHVRKLETLWLNYEKGKCSDDESETQFEKLRDEERIMTKINKHDVLEPEEPIDSKAREITIAYLNRFNNG
jgi:hypothetical protein